jgi:alpha-tubulin suppressor-like RCC1 family protein
VAAVAVLVGAALLGTVLLNGSCSVPDIDLSGKSCPCTAAPWICHPDGTCVRTQGQPSCVNGGPYDHDAGNAHTCAIECGALYCWGAAANGRLGLGAAVTADVERPTQVGVRTDWVRVSTGADHTCAIDAQQDVWCWGSNERGALGLGRSGDEVAEPVILSGMGGWADVSAGTGHTCGVRRDGTLWCWGNDLCGKLGQGTFDVSLDVPTQVGTTNNWVSVRGGDTLTCAMRDGGGLYCWGCNDDGQLAVTPGPPLTTPQRIDHARPFATYDVGQQHVCAVDVDGVLICWGINVDGQIGIGALEPVAIPEITSVDPGVVYDAVDVDAFTSCGLRQDATVACWGFDLDGMLGRGVPGDDHALVPTVVTGFEGRAVRHVVAGRFHSCVRLERDMSLWCTGNDENGQLGTGTPSRRNHAYQRVLY